MKTPVIVSMPRTGSNVALHMLYNYLKQNNLANNNLEEFVSLFHGMDHDVEVVNETINLVNFREVTDPNEREEKRLWLLDNRDRIIMERLELLKQYPKHTFKFITSSQPQEVYDWVRENNTCFFIERKNKIAQILSFALIYGKQRHYKPGNKVGERLFVPMAWLERFIFQKIKYDNYKKQFDNPRVAFYEDFVTDQGINEKAFFDAVGIELGEHHVPFESATIKTPYETSRIDYIENANEVISFIERNKGVLYG
jgi:hypothetical protein